MRNIESLLKVREHSNKMSTHLERGRVEGLSNNFDTADSWKEMGGHTGL